MVKSIKLYEKLCTLISIKKKLWVLMIMAYIYKPTRQYYWTKHLESIQSRRIKDWMRYHRNDRFPEVNYINQQDCDERVEEDIEIGRRKFHLPPMNLGTIIYYSLTTMYHFIGLFRSIGLILIQNGYLGLKRNLNCYILGRLCFHRDISWLMPYYELVSNIYNLNWRSRTMAIEKGYRLDCVLFLMSDTTAGNENCATGRSLASFPMESDNYLRELLYVEIINGIDGDKEYYLRPNRTNGARKHLSEIVNRVMFWSLLIALTIILSTFPLIMSAGLFDSNYIVNYPTCSPKIEKLAQEGRLNNWSVDIFSFDHRTLSIVFDVCINAIVWSDDLFAILFPTGVAIVIIEDLMIYRSCISQRLSRLLMIMRGRNYRCRKNCMARGYESMTTTPYFGYLAKANQLNEKWTKKWQHDELLFAKEIEILQRLVFDFFKQLRYYDRYVSFLITTYLELWAILFVATGYLGVYTDSIRVRYIVRFVQLMGLTSLGGLTIYLLRLSKSTKDDYRVLCAIMAFETDPKRMSDWSKILDIYTGRRLKFGFTVFFNHQLTWMTLLNYVATAISFLVAIETLMRTVPI